MERFEELKVKIKEGGGYMKLSKDEQSEYSALLKQQKESAPDEESPEFDKEALDSIIKEHVDAAVARMKEENESLKTEKRNLEKEVGLGDWKKHEAAKRENKTATLKVYAEDSNQDPGLVIDYKFIKNDFDENTRRYDKPLYRIDCLLADGSIRQHDVILTDLAQIAERETIEIVEMKTEEQVKSSGKIKVPARKNGYIMSKMGDVKDMGTESVVEALVFRTTGTAVCKRASGQKFEIDINKLNS